MPIMEYMPCLSQIIYASPHSSYSLSVFQNNCPVISDAVSTAPTWVRIWGPSYRWGPFPIFGSPKGTNRDLFLFNFRFPKGTYGVLFQCLGPQRVQMGSTFSVFGSRMGPHFHYIRLKNALKVRAGLLINIADCLALPKRLRLVSPVVIHHFMDL